MHPQINTVAIGVNDLTKARRFYESGLGLGVTDERGETLILALEPESTLLELWPWDALADDAGVHPTSSGFRGFTFSHIVERAAAVDAVLERAERAGGRISKAPRNAVWGYSAYLTDPDGYLWKVASEKRRPLFGRSADRGENGATRASEVPLTIGVSDMKRTKAFYAEGLGWETKKSYPKFVMFDGDGTSDLGVYKREALAKDADVPAEGGGFQGFRLAHFVDSADAVAETMQRAENAGAQIVKPGHFADPDGFLWKVAMGERE